MPDSAYKSFEKLLEDWYVMAPGIWENDDGPKDWWAVGNEDEGIVAYFSTQRAAYRFRLAEINRIRNG